MKAKARHWVNYGGNWHPAGEVFDIDPADAELVRQYADVNEPAKAPDEDPEPDRPGTEEPAKRGRKRKTE